MSKITARYRFRTTVHEAPPTTIEKVDVCYIGSPVDDRGNKSTKVLRATSKRIHKIIYTPEGQRIDIDDSPSTRERISKELSSAKRIVLDATTLGLAEILQLLWAAEDAEVRSVEFLYAEPLNYTKEPIDPLTSSMEENFQLTSNRTFRPVNGFNHQFDDSLPASHFLFLGFEPDRIKNALSNRGDVNMDQYRLIPIVGIPAYRSGWEFKSIKTHLSFFSDYGINQSNIHYCAADSVSEAYLTLKDLVGRIQTDQNQVFISPFGTKFHAIATALFLLDARRDHYTASLFYDHPIRVKDRSTGDVRWHHILVTIDHKS